MTTSVLLPLAAHLPDWHRKALEWFDAHSNQVVQWPGTLSDGTLLVSKAKAIYKPKEYRYALSVRQQIVSPYPDGPILHHPDSTWTLDYYQESLDLSATDTLYTNRGLIECYRDLVPIGVLIQVAPKPRSAYRVLGLALVVGFDSGYFTLEGSAPSVTPLAALRSGSTESRADFVADAFQFAQMEDNRERTMRSIVDRRGQPGFRATLLEAYGNACAITGYDASSALEAAHIVPYRGPATNHPTNGLLLRSDVHTLFDLHLLAIDHLDGRVIVSDELHNTKYSSLRNTTIRTPGDARLQPSKGALYAHRKLANL